MGRLPPFICLAHCTAYCEVVISVKNKFVGANKAASCGANRHNMATHKLCSPDVDADGCYIYLLVTAHWKHTAQGLGVPRMERGRRRRQSTRHTVNEIRPLAT